MSEIKVGSFVRLKNPDSYLLAYQKKVKDRVAIVESIQVFERRRYTSVYCWIKWQKRGNRGKEFGERHRLNDLELAP